VICCEQLLEFGDTSDPLDSTSLTSGEANNLFFWAIKDFDSLPVSLQHQVVVSLRELTRYVLDNAMDGLSLQKKNNSKKVLYYFVQCVVKAERFVSGGGSTSTSSNQNSNNNSTNNRKKPAGKSSKTTAFDWPDLRRECLSLLDRLVSSKLSVFWAMGLVEENFTTAIWRYALSLCEDKPAGLAGQSQQDIQSRATAVAVVSKTSAHFGSTTTSGSVAALSAACLNALLKHEHMAVLVAEIVRQQSAVINSNSNNFNNGSTNDSANSNSNNSSANVAPQMAHELVSDIAKLSVQSLSAQSLKNVSLFVEALARLDTALFTQFLPLLVKHIDCPAHQLRSAMLQAMGHVVAFIHLQATRSTATSTDDHEHDVESVQRNVQALLRKRDNYFNMLIERTHDTNPFTRSCLLKVWTSLVEAQAIPAKKVGVVSEVAVDRLSDKNALVRRHAVALLTSILDCNPFSGRLDQALFRRQQEEVCRLLNERIVQLSELSGVPMEMDEADRVVVAKQRPQVDINNDDDQNSDKNKSKSKKLTAVKRKRHSRETEDDDDDENDGDSVATASALNNKKKNKNDQNDGKDGDELKEEEEEEEIDEEELLKDAINDEIVLELQSKLEYLTSALELTTAIDQAVDKVSSMLASKTTSDIVESLRFFNRAVNFQVQSALAKFKE
jgi:hypothetical protein